MMKKILPAMGTLGLIAALAIPLPHFTATQAAHALRPAAVHVASK